MKPNVFIGSSSEALKLAQEIKTVLAKHFHVDLWSENIFGLGEDALNSLTKFLQCYDYALLVVTDDDKVTSRRKTNAAPRDNVIFELGLFMGALGRQRTFPVVAKTKKGPPKIPSDLFGNTAAFLPPGFHKYGKAKPRADLEKFLQPLIATIVQRNREAVLQLLPSTALAIGYFQNFVLPVCQELAARKTVYVGNVKHDLSHDNFDFAIVLPARLSDASTEGARKFMKTHRVKPFAIETKFRSYPFYVASSVQRGRLVFYDFPTTLRASQEAVRVALAGPYLGHGKYHALLEKKEISNFARTLNILLRESVAADFRDNVEIISC